MSALPIVIISGPDGLSAEAGERLRRHAQHEGIDIVIEQPAPMNEWRDLISQHKGHCQGLVLSPDLSEGPEHLHQDHLYRLLTEMAQQGVLLAEVHEDNIFKTDTEMRPLQPTGCHVRLVSGLGAAGYLLAVDALAHAGGVQ